MLSVIRRFRRGARTEPFATPIETGGEVVYAVGDIHGRHDLAGRLLERIMQDTAQRAVPCRIVFLGDYIDRGEGARETLALLRDFAGQAGVDCIFLMGNHEQMLLRFLEEPATGERWGRYGGLQTLVSYGVGGLKTLRDPDEASRARDALIEALGEDRHFIEALRPSHRVGNVFFAHAGADPEVPPETQPVGTLLWGCERFQDTDRRDGVWVAHGHYVVEQPTADRGRIAVDTGAYFSGRLTAARISDGEVSFLQG